MRRVQRRLAGVGLLDHGLHLLLAQAPGGPDAVGPGAPLHGQVEGDLVLCENRAMVKYGLHIHKLNYASSCSMFHNYSIFSNERRLKPGVIGRGGISTIQFIGFVATGFKDINFLSLLSFKFFHNQL